MSNLINGAKQMHKDTISYQECATKSLIRSGIDPITAAEAAADLTREGVEQKFEEMFKKGDAPEFTSKLAKKGRNFTSLLSSS